MTKITNKHGIDLPIAVWLLQDGYNSGAEDNPDPNKELVSVTTLLKPTKQLILSRLIAPEDREMDVADVIASRMGHSLHDGVERAWTEGNWQKSMAMLHHPKSIIDRIRINPDPNNMPKDAIPIHLEKRGFREIGGIMLTGQGDFMVDGAYRDIKTTSTFSFTSGSKDMDYILQGSMYRYILPEYIWKDKMRIEFIFTDWLKYRARVEPKYPQAKVDHKEFPLLSIEDTEQWILEKLEDIRSQAQVMKKKGQAGMRPCNDVELWRQEDSWKYYSNPETAKKVGKCTKRFDNKQAADEHLTLKGKGVVIHVPGEVKACPFCPAFALCEQSKEYFDDKGEPL